MAKQYDLVVIGAGTAAMTAASKVRAAGRSVAVVDHRPFGGTCALRGCDPKKMLVGGTSAVDHAKRMRGKGVAGEVTVDWPELQSFKRSFTDPVPSKQEQSYASKGVDTYHGLARFIAPNSVDVGGVALSATHILLASGAEPVKLGIPGAEYLATSETFLNLQALPRHIVLVGGGYIAAEFSNIAALAGAKVTILQRSDRMLKNFDPDVVGWLMEKFTALGIEVRTHAAVTRVDRIDTGFVVHADQAGTPVTVSADLVVHAGGRAPDFEVMDLNAAGVQLERGRLVLNEFLQSVTNPAVYAAGDVAQRGPALTPVSSHDAKVAAANILEGNHARPDYRAVPSVAFTQPAVAMVGLTEEAAKAQGLKFRVKSSQTAGWFTARQAAESTYGFKTLVEEGTDRVLGAHLVGPHAEDVINVFALAVRHGLTSRELKSTMFAYPTAASDIGYML
ncbi:MULTISPECIES: NAD(P)/FAD-dependent oxidoreductase [Ramlibacter]|uniref:NAD(P)/FAD-dependent oxidoreductase n=1 Tax=Ramlibacter aquaticus TaxID=2780094 RepID=A0ABR9SED7_9BURK|nr:MULTISPECIES: NAD(P)/FAD-dependent oxidoreductase [Ramlibacter]MBE7940097.1 NAD(P)/FAD-dependent oxidoreductase [Ramlibacter aquaticus]